MTAATRKQKRTLDVIASLTLMHGRAPKHGEIAAVLGVSRQSVTESIAWMRKKGLLRVNHDRWSATSRITREGVAVVAGLQ